MSCFDFIFVNICVGVLFFFFFLNIGLFHFFFFWIVLVCIVKVLFLCELVSVDRFMYYHMLVSLTHFV